MHLQALGRLAGIAAVKYAAGSVEATVVGLCADLLSEFAVLAGDDLFFAPNPTVIK